MKRLKILFSHHAQYQLKERRLSKNQITSAFDQPDRLTLQTDNRYQLLKLIKLSGKTYLLVIIYEQEFSEIKIVTAFITSKIKKYL